MCSVEEVIYVSVQVCEVLWKLVSQIVGLAGEKTGEQMAFTERGETEAGCLCILSVKYQNIRLQGLLSPNTRPVGQTKVPSLVPALSMYTYIYTFGCYFVFFFVTFKNNVIYQVKMSLRIGGYRCFLILFQELIFTPSECIFLILCALLEHPLSVLFSSADTYFKLPFIYFFSECME